MADTGGLVLGLPGLFVSCVQCFEYIQLSRNMEEDYDTAMLKLWSIGLSLSRWGASVGLGGMPIDDSWITVLEHEARPLLEGILKRFEKASAKSRDFELKAKINDMAVVDRDMNPKTRSLYDKMDAWMHNRYINQQNRVKKVRWAIYERKTFNALIADLRELVDELVKLSPAAESSQMQLCKTEVSELEDDSLLLMRDVARDDDEIMEEVVAAEIAERKQHGHVFEGLDIEGNSDLNFRAGNTVARGATVTGPGSNYKDIRIRGSGHVDTGDKYE